MRQSIADIVYARPAREPRRVWGIAAVFAVVVHGGALAAALRVQPTLEFWASDLARRVHVELGQTQNVVVEEKPAPPVETPPPPPSKPVAAAKAVPAATSAPQAPAEASQIIAAEPTGPADLTAMSFVTGSAKAYAGGKTTSEGKSKDYVAPQTPTSPTGASTPSYATPIALADANWSCPWPHEADVSDINRQSAVVRVTVDAEGRVTNAAVVKDPGLGFGSAAADCALRARFVPAKDAAGKAIASESPIRVRFER